MKCDWYNKVQSSVEINLEILFIEIGIPPFKLWLLPFIYTGLEDWRVINQFILSIPAKKKPVLETIFWNIISKSRLQEALKHSDAPLFVANDRLPRSITVIQVNNLLLKMLICLEKYCSPLSFSKYNNKNDETLKTRRYPIVLRKWKKCIKLYLSHHCNFCACLSVTCIMQLKLKRKNGGGTKVPEHLFNQLPRRH